MRKLLIVLLSLISCYALAQEASHQFDQANQLYRSGEYEKASQLYQQVVKNGFESAELYYNLGNSYFKMGNIPASILNYERAKKISPDDEDINYNLRLVNLRVVDKIEPIPRLFFLNWYSSFINLYSSGSWSTIGITFLWLSAITGIMIFVVRGITIQRLLFLSVLVFIAFTVLAFIGAFKQIGSENSNGTGIVFTKTVSVKSAPDSQSTDLFVLHEGVKVEFLDAIGEWRKIRLADGKIGWLPAGDVQII
ncbi:MAG: tetratricopeptide repeat protein [Ignavibacteriales bacterium]|nr:tetratricopeptide repeat protein [Ignavibacteriales bacterium]